MITVARRRLLTPGAVATGGYDAVVLAEPSLVHYWKLDEAAGATQALDSKGTLNSSSVSGVTFGAAALFTDGSTAASFPGTTSDILFGAAVGPGSGSFSVEMGFYLNALTLTRFFVNGVLFTNGYYVQVNTSGDLSFNYIHSGSIATFGGGTCAINTFYHYAAVWDSVANTVKQYLNGVGNTPSTVIGTLTAPTASGSLGGSTTGTSPMNGRLSKVAVYTAALTSTHVAAHYAAR